MRSQLTDRQGVELLKAWPTGALSVFALIFTFFALLTAPLGQASSTEPFNVELKSLGAATTGAGQVTDLKLEIKKERTGCHPIPPTTGMGVGCRFSFDPEVPAEDPRYEFHLEQDLRKIAIKNLGNTVVPNPNAFGGKYCDPIRPWVLVSGTEIPFWQCPGAVPLGRGYIEVPVCFPASYDGDESEYGDGSVPGRRHGTVACVGDNRFPGQGILVGDPVDIYPGLPRAGEAARLVLFYPAGDEERGRFAVAKFEVSVRVKTTSGGLQIDTVTDDIPDLYDRGYSRQPGCQYEVPGPGRFCVQASRVAMQPDLLRITIPGKTGAGRPPLLTNATTCDRQEFGFEAQGYRNNALFDDPDYNADPSPFVLTNGRGDGKTVTASRPYQATDCEKVKFDPDFRLRLDQSDSSLKADQVPEIIATIKQKADEGSIGKVVTELETKEGFTVNLDNKLKFCTRADLEADKCTAESEVGDVRATSPILYEDQRRFTGRAPEFTGKAYLLGLKGDSIDVGLRLTGDVGGQRDVPLTLYGTGKLAEGKLKIDFTNPYKNIPIDSFTLRLYGSKEKGLVKTSKVCPTAPKVTTRLTNQNGDKTVVREQAIGIFGCKDPSFNAELSTTEAGKPTSVTLQLAGNTKLGSGSVSFDLPRELMLATKQGKQAQGAQDGNLRVETPEGTFQAPFAFSGQGSNLALGALKAQGSSALAGFGGALSLNSVTLPAKQVKKKAKKRKRAKKASKKKVKAKRLAIQLVATGSGELKLQGLPQDFTGAEVSLGNNARQVFLITAKSCGQVLPFTANVKTADGRSLQLKDFVRLDACEKQRASGKKKQKASKRKQRKNAK